MFQLNDEKSEVMFACSKKLLTHTLSMCLSTVMCLSTLLLLGFKFFSRIDKRWCVHVCARVTKVECMFVKLYEQFFWIRAI